jgi:hypothetical protein
VRYLNEIEDTDQTEYRRGQCDRPKPVMGQKWQAQQGKQYAASEEGVTTEKGQAHRSSWGLNTVDRTDAVPRLFFGKTFLRFKRLWPEARSKQRMVSIAAFHDRLLSGRTTCWFATVR